MEREFHRWLKQTVAHGSHVEVGIGDDAAVLQFPGSNNGLVFSTDSIAEGTHFDLAHHALERIGRKSVAVNLSDLAAMAAQPLAAVVNFNLPNDFTLLQTQQLFSGCYEIAQRFELELVGGDTNRWNGGLVICVAITGVTMEGANVPWPIGGAKPDDLLVVSGSFGGSRAGHHLEFEPRIELASRLASQCQINAATDASDSLSLDAMAIARESSLGIEMNVDQVPIASAAHLLSSQSGRPALDHALTDGEDFELILAISEEQWESIRDDPDYNELTAIGRFTAQPGCWIVDADGNRSQFQPRGYTH